MHNDNSSSKDSDMAAKAQFVPVKRGKKRLKKNPVVKAMETMKHVIEMDPTHLQQAAMFTFQKMMKVISVFKG